MMTNKNNKIEVILNELRRRNVTEKTERRAFRMLNRIDTDMMSVDEIFVEVLNRLDAAEKVEILAMKRSNLGVDFDRLLQKVADGIDRDPNSNSGIQEIEDALVANDLEREKMFEIGLQTAIFAGEFKKAANFELMRIGSPNQSNWWEKVYACVEKYYNDGLRNGVNISLKIASSICAQAAEEAFDQNTKAALKNLEGVSLELLGERGQIEGLNNSIEAYSSALELYNREISPMNWAMVQNNLANALSELGKRGDVEALTRSISTYELALEIYTRMNAPLQWAETQNNLANVLFTLGEAGDETALARAVATYEAALEVNTRETTPLD